MPGSSQFRVRQPEDNVLTSTGKIIVSGVHTNDSRRSWAWQIGHGIHGAIRALVSKQIPHQHTTLGRSRDDIAAIRGKAGVSLQRSLGVAQGAVALTKLGWEWWRTLSAIQIGLQGTLKGVKDVVARTVGSYQDVLAIVAKLQSGPALSLSLAVVAEAALNVLHVKGCKRRLVEVANVVEDNGLGSRRGDCDDGSRGIVSGQDGTMQV